MTENKDTLIELLNKLEDADNGLVEFDPEKHKEQLLKAELKIDAYKYMDVKYTNKIEEVAEEIRQLQAIKKTLERKQDGLRALILWIFQQKNIEKFPGLKYVASLITKKHLVITKEPDAKDYLKYPNLIKREYSWKKSEFNKEYEKNDEIKTFAVTEKSEQIRFTLKKGLDND